jgi:MoaA/NifB/PqqE/SkfB family radical SAM enzyme
MCDIWKGNKNLKQLTEEDIRGLLSSLKKFGTKQVVMSGGEALLNPNFFRFCEILQRQNINITLLSTGLTLNKNGEQILKWVNDVIVSLDGNEEVHNYIRNIPNAFKKLKEGVQYIKTLKPNYRITARTVIHKLNYKNWSLIIDAAKEIGLNQISFLPADVSSHAFNRQVLWEIPRQHEILLDEDDVADLKNTIDEIIIKYKADFENKFIAESPDKLYKIYEYYAAYHNLNAFPYKKCNAPWVSAVIEADGNVRPCFFHAKIGNIHENSFEKILNSKGAVAFRKNLDMDKNQTCKKCVCYLNLAPSVSVR